MTALHYAPLALRDLTQIALYIADDNPVRALSFVEELRDKAARIAEHPFTYPSRDDLLPGLHAAVHGRYLLFYRIADDGVRIERVLHSARDVSAIFTEDGDK